jgi:hypothetical protein
MFHKIYIKKKYIDYETYINNIQSLDIYKY